MGLIWITIGSLAIFFARLNGGSFERRTIVDDSTIREGFWDLDVPFGVHLSGIYMKGMDYPDLKTLPKTMEKVTESLDINSANITKKYGPGSEEDLKQIIATIRELANDIRENRQLTMLPLANNEADRDAAMWNEHLKLRKDIEGDNLRWFFTGYILSGPYAYRRVNHAMAFTKTMRIFDPFEEMKQKGFTNSISSLSVLANYTMSSIINDRKKASSDELKQRFFTFLKISLWGNKFDLSTSKGEEIHFSGDPVGLLNSFEPDLLIDDSQSVWKIFKNSKRLNDRSIIVDIVMDNAGYELFGDLCFANFLVAHGLVDKVRFHVKQMPWYISDTMIKDFNWTVDYMVKSSDVNLKSFGDSCTDNLNSGKWSVETDPFWTTFHTFDKMKKRAPILYEKLTESTLVIFKGDLNYRKIVGDIYWDHETTLETVLTRQDFLPSNVLVLRTLKSQNCVGLKIDKIRLWKSDRKFMGRGKYGVINAAFNASCVWVDYRGSSNDD